MFSEPLKKIANIKMCVATLTVLQTPLPSDAPQP